jgi:hypothetical protein
MVVMVMVSEGFERVVMMVIQLGRMTCQTECIVRRVCISARIQCRHHREAENFCC